MKKIEVLKINKSSDDIWKLLQLAVNSKNWALIQSNLNRLHALQKYYCQTLTIQSWQLECLEAENKYLIQKSNELEEENMKYLFESKGQEYQEIKNRIDKLFAIRNEKA